MRKHLFDGAPALRLGISSAHLPAQIQHSPAIGVRKLRGCLLPPEITSGVVNDGNVEDDVGWLQLERSGDGRRRRQHQQEQPQPCWASTPGGRAYAVRTIRTAITDAHGSPMRSAWALLPRCRPSKLPPD